MIELPSIPDFYRDKTIFITGGSGFIGKVLIEKLLRSCPDLKTIYLLMREKKGRSPEERIKPITDLPLFDLVRSQNPDFSSKIKTVVGDVQKLGLGLTHPEHQLLIDEVNIVFHIAASVRFDDNLADAVIMNTRGTREVAKLALETKNLDVLVHVSTTYCNTNQKVIEEKLYPAHADWRKTIEIAETTDRHVLNVLTEKYINPLPNTYTFTKSLAEHVVYDMCNGKIPTVIYRPSIVISTALEPVPGWIDNFNGPIGLLTACGKGIVRTVYSDPNLTADYVPVDVTVKAMIISSWKQGTYNDKTQKLDVSFYNGSNCNIQNISITQMVDLGKKICVDVPFSDVLWYPRTSVTKCYYYFFIQTLFYQVLPALFIDGLLKLLGKKPMLMKIQRRIYAANMAISYFALNEWKFVNEKCYNLKNELVQSDIDNFSYKEEEIEVYEYFKTGTIGAKKYLLKEGDDLERDKTHSKRMLVLAQVFSFLWYFGLLWLVLFKFNMISFVINKYNGAILYFMTD